MPFMKHVHVVGKDKRRKTTENSGQLGCIVKIVDAVFEMLIFPGRGCPMEASSVCSLYPSTGL